MAKGDTKIDFYNFDPSLQAAELSRYFAEIVCGPDKQDVAALIVSPKGYGKSYSGMELCWGTAIEISKMVGGSPFDYFPYDKEKNWLPNCATIITEDIVDMLAGTRKHNVYLLDDIGVGWNARKFRDKGNILLNDIFELIRIDNTVLIMTVMDQDFIDKVPRSIIPYFIEISRKMHFLNINELKVFQFKKLYRAGKFHHTHISIDREKYTRFYCGLPPTWMNDAYDHMRSVKTLENRSSKVAEFKETDKAPSKREQQWQIKSETYGPDLTRLHKDGYTDYEIAKRLGISQPTVSRLKGILNLVS